MLDLIRRLGQRREGLVGIHATHPALYACARRCFGSWAAAVRAAGMDYWSLIRRARQQAIVTRRRKRRALVAARRSGKESHSE
ncbi:MAG TPA: hypothetical protein VMS88_03910 [Terriglobales bacterium]|nr:hypothetical protein [Terriglobales bacterium]